MSGPENNAVKEQIGRITEAFAHEMTSKYWQSTMPRQQFLDEMRDDLERLATIVRAVRS